MMNIRRSLLASLTLVTALALVAGCGKKADQTATTSASDSLLSASPIEPTPGIQPDPAYQSEPEATPSPAATTPPRTPAKKPASKPSGSPTPAPAAPSVTVPAGTAVKITLGSQVSSESATPGSSWSGTVKEAVVVGSMAPFPAGSVVHGVVSGVEPAAKGSRAFVVLRITSIEANGRSLNIGATTDSVIAGSTRARNLGAIAGGAAAGALIGKAVGGSNKGAIIGGILGGAAATGGVAASKGYQVVLKEGTEMVFHVDSDTKLNL
jgi:hypothetical protein